MIRRNVYQTVCAVSFMFVLGVSEATVVDFDSFSDGDTLTNQVAGMTFSNAGVISAGISLSEFEFPPLSGSNVVIDTGGTLVIDFSSPVDQVGGYFTYTSQLAFSAFDVGFNLISSSYSVFSQNYVSSGNAPNEFWGVSGLGGISRIVVAGDPAGYSFVMDDLSFTNTQIAPVPEPETWFMLLAGLAVMTLSRRARIFSR